MTQTIISTEPRVLVAIDIAKVHNDVLVELPDGSRRKFKVANKLTDYQQFVAYLINLKVPCLIGFEATGNYHRPLAYYLGKEGFSLRLISSLAAAKTREALYNSWDKNDPKDAQVILHMMKTGVSQIYCDPMVHGTNELQELSKAYYQVSLRKVKVQHSMMTHYLPLYFPEAQKYFHSSRAEWFSSFLLRFTVPAIVLKYTKEDFISAAWDTTGRKVSKRAWLSDFYETARSSIGIPVPEDSEAVRMFRLVLEDHIDLCKMRQRIEQQAQGYMQDNEDYHRLQTIPGIGPITALTVLAETGDMRRFSHYKKFLKYCGLDLSTEQSGRFRGMSKLSKRGNSHLRLAFWVAATVAIRMQENTFRKKYESYIRTDPANKDLRRKAYTAVAAKMARVAYSVIKTGTDYRCFYESAIPSGKIPSPRAVEAVLTS
jgi:transposase